MKSSQPQALQLHSGWMLVHIARNLLPVLIWVGCASAPRYAPPPNTAAPCGELKLAPPPPVLDIEARQAHLSGDTNHDGGGPSKVAIKAAIDRHVDEMRSCYERFVLSDVTRSARVVVGFGFDASGRVFQVEVREGDASLRELQCCVLHQLARWQFPASEDGGVVFVEYPFVFEPAPSSR